MKKEHSAFRERIKDAWRSDHNLLACTMAEVHLAAHPDDGVIWGIYSDTLRLLGRFKEAKLALQTARGLADSDENKAAVCESFGDLSRNIGDYLTAERWYREGAALQPDDGRWQLFIGATLRRQDRDQEAEACYRRALTMTGHRDEYLLNLGYVLQARGAFLEAAECYAEALSIDPEYALAKKALDEVRLAIAFQEESR
jgi:tetratricopeptide (TPR) repeat protein